MKLWFVVLTICIVQVVPVFTRSIDLDYESAKELVDKYLPKNFTLPKDILDLITLTKETQETGFSPKKCIECKAFMRLVDHILSIDAVIDLGFDLAKAYCIYERLFDPRICSLGVDEWGPLEVFLHVNYQWSSDEVCYKYAGKLCARPTIKTPKWTLNFSNATKPPYVPRQPPPADADLARVLFLSDIHLDLAYEAGSNAQCHDPLCCRPMDRAPMTPEAIAGDFGSISQCDLPIGTLNRLLERLSKEHFDWVMVTGDLPPHDVYNQTISTNSKVISVVNDMFIHYFPDTPVLNAIGNHEANPVDQFVPPYMDFNQSDPNPMSWLYDLLWDKWSTWLPNSTNETIRRGGYWAWEFLPGFKIVSANTGYGQTADFYLQDNNTDFTGMLQWMVDELQDAEDRNLRVWLASHHRDCDLPYWSDWFYYILQRYENTIDYWINGHTHDDEMGLFYDPALNNTPVIIKHTTPGVTSYDGYDATPPYDYSNVGANMAYQVAYIDAKRPNASFQIVDFETHFLNLTRANEEGYATWELEYTMRDAYEMENLQPVDYDDLLNRFSTQPLMVNKYKFYQKKSTRFQYCDSDCGTSTADGLRIYLPTAPPQPGK